MALFQVVLSQGGRGRALGLDSCALSFFSPRISAGIFRGNHGLLRCGQVADKGVEVALVTLAAKKII